jgi:membrane glycosyltransferase
MLLSAALAPVRMLFHTQFVIAALTNLQFSWKSPPREDAETTWGEATRRHGLHTLFGLGWAGFVYWLAPAYILWMLPIVGALALAIPISVLSSRVTIGRALRRVRLFVIPEEDDPPRELRSVRHHAGEARSAPGFVDAVIDPQLNALACALVPRPARLSGVRGEALRVRTVITAIEHGPDALTDRQKRLVLTDPIALSELHAKVSTSPAAHPAWHAARARALSSLAKAS